MKPYVSDAGLSNREGQSCFVVSRNKTVKPIQYSFVPVTILRSRQLSTVVALGRKQGPRLGVMNRGLIYPLEDVSPTSVPYGNISRESCNGHLHPCHVLVVHESCNFFFFSFFLFCYSPAPLNLIGLFPLDHFPEKSC